MKKLLLSLFGSMCVACASAYPTNQDGTPITTQQKYFRDDGYVEICDKAEIMYRAAALTKMKPIFISGNQKEYAMVVYVDLKTEDSLILRVNKDVGCLVGEGTQMFLKFPDGIQEI